MSGTWRNVPRALSFVLLGAALGIPGFVLANVTLSHTPTSGQPVSASGLKGNFDALNNGKLDRDDVIAFTYDHTSSTADCASNACSRLSRLNGIDNIVVTASLVMTDGVVSFTPKPVTVMKYHSGSAVAYNLLYDNGATAFPNAKVMVIAVRQ